MALHSQGALTQPLRCDGTGVVACLAGESATTPLPGCCEGFHRGCWKLQPPELLKIEDYCSVLLIPSWRWPAQGQAKTQTAAAAQVWSQRLLPRSQHRACCTRADCARLACV